MIIKLIFKWLINIKKDIPNRKFQQVKRMDEYFVELGPDILNEKYFLIHLKVLVNE